MDLEILREICAGNCVINNLAGLMLDAEKIIPRTVRSKGQYRMQRFFYIQGGSAKFELNTGHYLCLHLGDGKSQ